MARRRRRTNDVFVAEQIIRVPLTDIQPYESNPRDNAPAVESVKNSIQAFGFVVPVVLDDDNTIVAGHTRFYAAEDLNMQEVPCIRASHLTDEQIRQFRIIDNKVAELARWDFDLLAGELEGLADSGIDWTDFGFVQDELDSLLDQESEQDEVVRQVMRPARPGNRDTKITIGEFKLVVPTRVYREWASSIYSDCEYDDNFIQERLLELLGIDQYLDQDDGSTQENHTQEDA